MAATVKLEDGSEIDASTLGMSGAVAVIAEVAGEVDVRLERWLADVSDRTAPFLEFDLRGLSAQHRAAFGQGVIGANERFAGWNQAALYSPGVDVIRRFHQRLDTYNTPVSSAVRWS